MNKRKEKNLKTAGDVVYYNVGNFIYLGAQWIISVALVRMGGFEDAGYFSLAMSVCNIFAMIANYGLRAFQVSDIQSKYSDNDYVLSRVITVSFALVLCLIYSAAFQRNAFEITLIMLYMIYKCIEAYSDVLTAVFQKNDKMIYAGVSLGAKGILNLVIFLAAYVLTKNLILSVGLMAAGSLAVLFGYDFVKIKGFYSHGNLFKNADGKKVARLLKDGCALMLVAFFATAFNSIPKMIIERKENAESLGVFSSIAVPTVIITTFAAGMILPIAPKLAERYNNRDGVQIAKALGVCTVIIAVIGGAATAFSAAVGRPILKLFFGEEILPYFSLLYYMIWASVIIAVNNCLSVFLTAVRKLKQELAFSVLSCVLVAGLSYLLIGKSGIYGAAYAMIITLLIQFVFETAYVVGVIQKQCKP